MMCEPAVPIEARVYMSGFKFWYKNKYKTLQVLLSCLLHRGLKMGPF